MPSKKNVFIATQTVLLEKENEMGDRDINAKIVTEIFKVKDNYPDCKVSYGMNMFGKNKAFLIYQINIREAANGSGGN